MKSADPVLATVVPVASGPEERQYPGQLRADVEPVINEAFMLVADMTPLPRRIELEPPRQHGPTLLDMEPI